MTIYFVLLLITIIKKIIIKIEIVILKIQNLTLACDFFLFFFKIDTKLEKLF